MGLIKVDMEQREYRSAGAMGRAALARVRRGRDSPQTRGGGGSGAFETDSPHVAYAVRGVSIAVVTDDVTSVSTSTAATVHAALVQPAGIVGQHGCWLCLGEGASGIGI